MACNLSAAIEFSKAYSAGDFRIDSVANMIEVKKHRDNVLSQILMNQYNVKLAGVNAILEILYKRAAGESCIYRPMDMIYLGLTEATDENYKSMVECKNRFNRCCGNERMSNVEIFDRLLPLTNKREMEYSIETIEALAQMLHGKLNPPGPATPPPDN